MRIGVNLTSIGVPAAWWLDTARLLESAGFSGVWCWDHFVSRGRLSDPVLECWSILGAAAAKTERIHVGSFVSNVMNRHPQVLARTAATVQELSAGRLELGIGIGGHPAEHLAYGIDFPAPAERSARLTEAVEVLRRLWTGGPVDFEGRFYRLTGAHAYPRPDPPPRIVVGGEKPAGARLAARVGDAWATNGPRLAELMPSFRAALQDARRERQHVAVLATVELERGVPPGRQPLLADLLGEAERWRELGADELVIHWVRPRDIPGLLAAAERASLG